MRYEVPTGVMTQTLYEIKDIVSAVRYDGQKASAINRIDRALAEVGRYEEPSIWERIKNRIIAIFLRGKAPLMDSGIKRAGQISTTNDSES